MRRVHVALFLLLVGSMFGCNRSSTPADVAASADTGWGQWQYNVKELNPEIGRDSIHAVWGSWHKKFAFVILSDAVRNAKGGSEASGARSEYNGEHLSDDGHKIEWRCETKDGRTGTFVLDGKSYDLAQGSLFLLCRKEGENKILQLNRKTFELAVHPASLEKLLKEDREIQKFVAKPGVAK